MATKRNLAQVKNKEGRVDCLLFGLSNILTQKLEEKLKLPGLAGGVMPILEHEIKRNIPSHTVIPQEYRELTRVLGGHIEKISRKEVEISEVVEEDKES